MGTIIPKEKKVKAGKFILWIVATIFWFIAGFHFWDDSYKPYQRIAGIVGVVIFCAAFIYVGYMMIYYGWFVFGGK